MLYKRSAQLTPIPDSAEIILSAQWHRERRPDGAIATEIYAIDSNADSITRITFGGAAHDHFAVSPNRKLIAAGRWDSTLNGQIDWNSTRRLWVYDIENGQEWPLAPEMDAGLGGIDWSPDGEFIYCSMRPDKRTNTLDVHRIRPDGTGFQNVTKGIELKLGAQTPGKWVSDVGVSPDGEWVAFIYSVSAPKTVVAVCRVDGSEPRLVTDGGPLPPKMYGPWTAGDFDPEFSPDGSHVVFQRATGKVDNWGGVTSHDIMTCAIDGSDLRNLSPEGNTAVHGMADWSEDGRIIFSEWSQADGYVGPTLVNADGTGYHRLEKAKYGTWVRWIPPLRG